MKEAEQERAGQKGWVEIEETCEPTMAAVQAWNAGDSNRWWELLYAEVQRRHRSGEGRAA